MNEWKREDRFFQLHTPWAAFYGEHLIDHMGVRLEYYRVEKADSVIVVPLQGDRLLFPKQQYRPGAGKATLDFPGGRVDESRGVAASAARILEKELGIPAAFSSQASSSGPAAPAVSSASGGQTSSSSQASSSGPASEEKAIVELISPQGYLINSSFSNQRQFNALARIPEHLRVPQEYLGSVRTFEEDEIESLLAELECAQCRLALFEFLRSSETPTARS